MELSATVTRSARPGHFPHNMEFFSKTRIRLLLFAALGGFSLGLCGAGLPAGLDGVKELLVAWEITVSFPGSDSSQVVYFGVASEEFTGESELPPGSPDQQDDRVAFQKGLLSYSTCVAKCRDFLSIDLSSYDLVLSRQADSGKCLLSIRRIAGALPAGNTISLIAKTGDGTPIAVWNDATESNAVTTSLPPGTYSIRVKSDKKYYDKSFTVALSQGWNLVSLPFTSLTSAKVAGRNLPGDVMAFLSPDELGGALRQVESLSELNDGTAFWIYSEADGAKLVASGRAPQGDSGDDSFFNEERLRRVWNLLGIVAGVDDSTREFLQPTKNLPEGVYTWNTASSLMVRATGFPEFGKGYFVPSKK